tara:strand:+ start:72 stop:509 length:438 start_codon:yes stop_codon:yes gene_type:complete
MGSMPVHYRKYNPNEENVNRDGLKKLYWELLNCPFSASKDSGYLFCEREPLLILDDIVNTRPMMRPIIIAGYASKRYAEFLGLKHHHPLKLGRGIRFRVTNSRQRFFWVSELILRGVTRIQIDERNKWVQFDTDNYLGRNELVIM